MNRREFAKLSLISSLGIEALSHSSAEARSPAPKSPGSANDSRGTQTSTAQGGGVQRFGVYDFGLSTAEEQRAAGLQRDSIIIDMLFQGPCGYRSFTEDMLAQLRKDAARLTPEEQYFAAVFAPIRAALVGKSDNFRECWEQSGITAGNRQVGFGLPAYAIAQAQFDTFPWLTKALKAAEIRAAKAKGLRAGFISTQDSDGLQDRKLNYLQVAYDLGLRMMGLSYNLQNAVAGGCMDRFDGGVTTFGAELIARMDELGIIIDMAHSGRQAALDACQLSKKPVVASHTSAKSLRNIPRAKSDEVIRAIAATGGVIGVVALPGFLAPGNGLTIEAMLDHIDYIAKLAGWQHVAIGTDGPLQIDQQTQQGALQSMAREYSGSRNAPEPPRDRAPTPSLIGFDDYRDFPNITRGLVKRGYSDEQIRGILGENFLRVFEAVCG